jgi:2'-5' RNA ligase
VRLFFALWPNTVFRAGLAEKAAALHLEADARPVPQENYHATLAFIGEVDPCELPALRQLGHSRRAAACSIQLDAYEHWAGAQAVVAVARQVPEALIELAKQLRISTGAAELSWRLHVTLARKVAQAPVLQAMSPFRWKARSFSLVHSEVGGAGSVYTVVDTWPLLDEQQDT